MITIRQPFLIHNHDETSNFRLLDSTNKTEALLDKALEMGLPGLCITNHETTTSHIRAYRHIEANKDRFKDFTIGYGNEIYLIHREDAERAKENNDKIRYYHFVLVAKNSNGHKGIRELSSQAWLNSYHRRGIQRVPLFKDQFKSIMSKYKGDIIGSTACLGGEIPQLLLKAHNIHELSLDLNEAIDQQDTQKVDDIIQWVLGKSKRNNYDLDIAQVRERLTYNDDEVSQAQEDLDNLMRFFIDILGDDFYIELQPATREIQNVVNILLLGLSEKYNVKPIVTTDTHYLDKSYQKLHQIYLNSKDGDREVADFYNSCYLMDRKELEKFFDPKLLDVLINNTLEIKDKIKPIQFGNETQIPQAHIPNFNDDYIEFFSKYDRYTHIQKLLQSDSKQDQYCLHLIYKGIKEKSNRILSTYTMETILNRIDLEVEQLNELSEFFNQPMSGYFLFVKELIDIVWEVSFVAPNRGSAACWIINYLLGITQLNPLDYDLPYWRFLHIARGRELPDMKMSVPYSLKMRCIFEKIC